MDVFERAEWVFSDKSFRKKLAQMLGIPEIPDDVIGWSSKFYDGLLRAHFDKNEIPDIEIYTDRIAKYSAEYLDGIFSFIIIEMFNHAFIHELIHVATGIKNEVTVEAATRAILKERIDKLWKIVNPDAWMWYYIACPKLERKVTWNECLSCTDRDKHPSCPLLKIRIDAYPRQYELGKYHVTELSFPRYSYYNRLYKHTMAWDNYYDMLFGKALGWYIESKFGEHQREVTLTDTLERDGEQIKVQGHADLVDDDAGNLFELKFYYRLKYLYSNDKPNEEHEFQARTYYTMGMKLRQWQFKDIEHVKMLYYGKTRERNVPRRIEFELPLSPVDYESKAWILHDAVKNNIPPREKCPAWKCVYCDHRKQCEIESRE